MVPAMLKRLVNIGVASALACSAVSGQSVQECFEKGDFNSAITKHGSRVGNKALFVKALAR